MLFRHAQAPAINQSVRSRHRRGVGRCQQGRTYVRKGTAATNMTLSGPLHRVSHVLSWTQHRTVLQQGVDRAVRDASAGQSSVL